MVTDKPHLIGMTRGSHPPPLHQPASSLSSHTLVPADTFHEPGPEPGPSPNTFPSAGVRQFETLVTMLGDPDPGTRIAAADALGKMGDPRAINPLFVASMDALPGVKRAAWDALARIMHPDY